VLRELLGLSAEQIKDLNNREIISQRVTK